MIGKIVKVIFK